MITTVCQPLFVVNGCSGSQSSLLLAQLTQRIGVQERFPNLTPPSAIPLVALGVTPMAVIVLHV